MAEQSKSAADVIKIVKDNDVRFVRLWFTDVLGQLKSFSINAAELEDAFDGGMGFDGSSITGFNPIEESDMIAMPDPSTFAIIPWRPEEDAVAGDGAQRVARLLALLDATDGGDFAGGRAEAAVPPWHARSTSEGVRRRSKSPDSSSYGSGCRAPPVLVTSASRCPRSASSRSCRPRPRSSAP